MGDDVDVKVDDDIVAAGDFAGNVQGGSVDER
jgi:hypothetical protein